MKRIVRNIFALLTILCVSTAVLGSTIVMAEDLSVAVTYQQSSNSWKIEGTAGSKAYTAVTLKIYKSENGSFSAQALKDREGLVKLVYTAEGGAFSDSINFGTFFSSGSYTVEVHCADFSPASTSFLYVNPDESASIIENINNAPTKDAVAQLLGDNCYQLGIDEEEYALKADCINEIIFNRKPEDGYDTQSFLSEYNNALCVYDLKNSEDSLESIFQKHSEAIALDYTNDVKAHGEQVVSIFRERLKTENYNEVSIERAMKENLLVARIQCTERYTYIEGIIEGEIASGAYDLGDYSKVKNKENVFKHLYNNKHLINDYADIKTVFEAAAKTARDSEKSSGGGGGGGGGGSSSSSGSASRPDSSADISITEAGIAAVQSDILAESIFPDVKNHWAKEYIKYMTDKKIANGYPDGGFNPDGYVTRAEFVKFVTTAFNLPKKDANTAFGDVKENDWFYPYVSDAVSNGIIVGFEGKFKPNDKISRQDAAVILGRLTESTKDMYNNNFNDEAEISEYALSSVKRLAAMGIIKGMNNEFQPLKNITRAEAAAMIVRMIQM